MITTCRTLTFALLFALACVSRSAAVELKVSRDALERTLRQQLFSGPSGRYYMKGNAQTPCFVYASDPKLSFGPDRIVVRIQTHAKLGKSVGGACVGLPLSLPAEVSLAPEGEGEIVGFRDARIDRVSGHKELDFFLVPFLSRKIPSGMKVNATELLRQALAGSTASSGYKVTLDRLKIHSLQIQGDTLVLDVDFHLSVQ